jgi:fatty acid desaturase
VPYEAGVTKKDTQREELPMLWTIFVILIIMWMLGMVTSYTLGGFIHILLLLAIGVVLIRVIQGRNPV